MRIVIDMQGAQTESRFRGIGRYTMAFAKAVARNRGRHEIILALNAAFPDTIEPIRAAFEGLLSQENIRLWHFEGPVREIQPGNDARRAVAERLRESFLASLEPDVVHVSSMFEGYLDDAVTSIGQFGSTAPVTAIFYDLIPLLNSGKYLSANPAYERYYLRKLDSLKKSAALLAISDYATSQGSSHLQNTILTIWAGVDERFQEFEIPESELTRILRSHSIEKPFVLYAGGADERKNLVRLVQAYASLPFGIRRNYQLVLAGKFPAGEIARLNGLAGKYGLGRHELIMTGYISDHDVTVLYNTCHVFVFPSWDEGFGLPLLEAMACGAPVIAADSASLPEVVGLKEALFDPFDVDSISSKLSQGLQDDLFRNRLRQHGLTQARQFSWDSTARKAIAAWEALPKQSLQPYPRRSLAVDCLYNAVAPFLSRADEASLVAAAEAIGRNQLNGVERQLFVDVSELCQRDAATGVQRVVRSYLKWLLHSPPVGFRVEPVYATPSEGYRYARRFAGRFLHLDHDSFVDEPVRWQRGDIFLGLDMQHHVQLRHSRFYRQLMCEGVVVKFVVYDLLPVQLDKLFPDAAAKDLHEQWLTMIASLDGAIGISEATVKALEEWMTERAIFRSPTFQTTWIHIGADLDGSQPSRGVPDDATALLEILRIRPTFLCVSTIEPRKRQEQILDAVDTLWRHRVDVNLVFVGREGWQVSGFIERLRSHSELGKRLFWLAGISDEYLEGVYKSSTCLISASLNEGFGLPLVEAAQHGLPIVARDIPVFREVAQGYAEYFRGEGPEDLARSLTSWLQRYREGTHTQSKGMPWSTWQQSTENLKAAILAKSCPRRQLLVDVSELVQRDAKTGIQRVVRNVLRHWLLNPPAGWRVEPVYATNSYGYRYARAFTARFIGPDEALFGDDPIDYQPEDAFLGLDLQPHIQVAHRGVFEAMRKEGVLVQFVVYDLLAVQMPGHFPPRTDEGFVKWLEVVAESDGALCISKAVAKDLADWIAGKNLGRARTFRIDHFPLGADMAPVSSLRPTTGVEAQVLANLQSRPTFLMVGTLEPRKGHADVLEAFEWLWSKGNELNLVIVGKPGWMVDALQQRLRTHAESGGRLFWLEGADDDYLRNIYRASTCLIAASHGEGFGLPIIEAAQHNLPVIARDLPVFREVAGNDAFYFKSGSAKDLADRLLQWLRLYETGAHPSPRKVTVPTWGESASRLLNFAVAKGNINASFEV